MLVSSREVGNLSGNRQPITAGKENGEQIESNFRWEASVVDLTRSVWTDWEIVLVKVAKKLLNSSRSFFV
jgi:hypothetical protein